MARTLYQSSVATSASCEIIECKLPKSASCFHFQSYHFGDELHCHKMWSFDHSHSLVVGNYYQRTNHCWHGNAWSCDQLGITISPMPSLPEEFGRSEIVHQVDIYKTADVITESIWSLDSSTYKESSHLRYQTWLSRNDLVDGNTITRFLMLPMLNQSMLLAFHLPSLAVGLAKLAYNTKEGLWWHFKSILGRYPVPASWNICQKRRW